ncbi:flavodoxin family protein [Eubacteriales bacterium OttesenSCG-928-A19]|nr:flavodoxin family protein [Eubacteriales bacterium OttesenSCG-928-A19]
MKVVLVNGSPNANGCTFTGLSIIRERLRFYCKEGLVPNIRRDKSNYRDFDERNIKWIKSLTCLRRCVFDGDAVNTVAQALREADGIILGSAVHFASATGAATSFFDRLFYCTEPQAKRLKFGAAIVSCRRGGASATFDQLNKYFTISQMPVVSSCYWNNIHGYTPEDVYKDEEGVRILKTLADNMAYLIKCKHQSDVAMPEALPVVMTSFIR